MPLQDSHQVDFDSTSGQDGPPLVIFGKSGKLKARFLQIKSIFLNKILKKNFVCRQIIFGSKSKKVCSL